MFAFTLGCKEYQARSSRARKLEYRRRRHL